MTIMYGNFDSKFLDALALELKNKRVLEIFAGNGYLASELEKRGVDITATTLFAGHDGHDEGIYTDVIEMDALSAVRTYKEDHDVLVVSWPTTSEETWKASMEWGKEIVFIGESYNYNLPGGGYAGCASDLFFHSINIKKKIEEYEPKNMLDGAMIVEPKPDAIALYNQIISATPNKKNKSSTLDFY